WQGARADRALRRRTPPRSGQEVDSELSVCRWHASALCRSTRPGADPAGSQRTPRKGHRMSDALPLANDLRFGVISGALDGQQARRAVQEVARMGYDSMFTGDHIAFTG